MGIKIDGEFLFDDKRRGPVKEIGLDENGGNFVVSLGRTAESVGYMTVLPVSPSEYRKSGGLSSAMIEDRLDYIIVYDDYGHRHTLEADRHHLDILIADCEKKGLHCVGG